LFFRNEGFGRRARNLKYATVSFIAAFHPIPDRPPSRGDRRHCGRQPAGRRRIDLLRDPCRWRFSVQILRQRTAPGLIPVKTIFTQSN